LIELASNSQTEGADQLESGSPPLPSDLPEEGKGEDLRVKLTSNIPPPPEKKRTLQAMVAVTTKDFQKQYNVPVTGNTMAKFKYADFKVVWQAFCEEATLDQLERYEKKLATLG
jgi:hypothetical protein